MFPLPLSFLIGKDLGLGLMLMSLVVLKVLFLSALLKVLSSLREMQQNPSGLLFCCLFFVLKVLFH
jgi:hypothetical protein